MTKNEDLIFTDTSNDTNDAILGTLEGPCADFINATRNGRIYDDSLWEKVFNEDPIVNELLENGGIPGELDHPTDRTELDSSRLAILMREKPKKRKDGKLWAKFDILNTPLGKIAHTLAKAGFKLGISSRGSGDTFTAIDGQEHVDEDSYEFKCFDLVLVPSVKAARLNLVTEGLSDKFNYKKALVESLNNASVDDRIVMQETLQNLHIDLNEDACSKDELKNKPGTDDPDIINEEEVPLKDEDESDIDHLVKETMTELFNQDLDEDVTMNASEIVGNTDNEEDLSKLQNKEKIDDDTNHASSTDVDDIDEELHDEEVVNDDPELLEELQKALTEKEDLRLKNRELQQRLSVCYAKEAKQEEKHLELSRKIQSLNERIKSTNSLRQRVHKLEEELSSKDEKINQLKSRNDIFKEKLEESKSSSKAIMDTHSEEVNRLKTSNRELTEKLSSINTNEKSLTEQLANLKKDQILKSKEFNNKLDKANQLAENYRNIASKAVDKYIQLQAKILGVSPLDIKNKLNEHYSFNDIDNICRNIAQYNINTNSLSFSLSSPNIKNVNTRLVESKQPSYDNNREGDEVDDDLLRMTGLKI